MAAPQAFPSEQLCMEWQQRRAAGAGLCNAGNTCFLNSVLQCLTYTPPLTNYLLSREHSQSCHRQDFCVMCLMEAHVNKVLHSSGRHFTPTEFLSVLPRKAFQRPVELLEVLFRSWRRRLLTTSSLGIAPHFKHGMQEDAQEFLLYTLNAMESSCLSGSSKCDKRVAASKECAVQQAPKVLTLCLKRFDDFTGRKVDKIMKYPEYLDLQPYVSDRAGEPLLYSLYAVLVHAGATCDAGHYFCFSKVESNFLPNKGHVAVLLAAKDLGEKVSFLAGLDVFWHTLASVLFCLGGTLQFHAQIPMPFSAGQQRRVVQDERQACGSS
ncbi:ubiquitin carboxyl-terminal hydrolase 42-like [Porphyrio hochstetteri]